MTVTNTSGLPEGDQSPSSSNSSRVPVVCGLVGAVIVAGVWLVVRGPEATQVIAAIASGLMAGLTGWLVADTVIDDRRRSEAAIELGGNPAPAWAADALARATATAPAPDRFSRVEESWAGQLSRQLWLRYAMAGLASVSGAIAAIAQFTPDRVLKEDFLVLGSPALVGFVLAWLGWVTTDWRNLGWRDLFRKWADWAEVQELRFSSATWPTLPPVAAPPPPPPVQPPPVQPPPVQPPPAPPLLQPPPPPKAPPPPSQPRTPPTESMIPDPADGDVRNG